MIDLQELSHEELDSLAEAVARERALRVRALVERGVARFNSAVAETLYHETEADREDRRAFVAAMVEGLL